VSGGILEIEVNNGAGRVTAPWDPARSEITLPILGYAPSSQLGIFARALEHSGQPIMFTLEDIDLVTDLDESAAREGVPGGLVQNDGGWVDESVFDCMIHEGSFAVLELTLHARGLFSGTLDVEVYRAEREHSPLLVPVGRVQRQGRIYVNLHGAEGSRLSRVLVRGTGPPPQRVLDRARVLIKL
jgi:hypothetical protein